jgi:hypothetical protein
MEATGNLESIDEEQVSSSTEDSSHEEAAEGGNFRHRISTQAEEHR